MKNIKAKAPTKGRIARFVIWICSKFIKEEIEQIVAGLLNVLAGKNPDVKPKDDFKQKHPNYRNFYVDPTPPLPVTEKEKPKYDYKTLLYEFEKENGYPLSPVKKRKNVVRCDCSCPACNAPSDYMYWNDGKKRTRQKCKVCKTLFQVKKNLENPHLRFTLVHIAR